MRSCFPWLNPGKDVPFPVCSLPHQDASISIRPLPRRVTYRLHSGVPLDARGTGVDTFFLNPLGLNGGLLDRNLNSFKSEFLKRRLRVEVSGSCRGRGQHHGDGRHPANRFHMALS